MTIRQIEYVQACMNQGSLNKAAEFMHTTPPNISKAIRLLEEELNMVLFKRTSKGMVPTEDGKWLMMHGERILNECDIINKKEASADKTVFTITCSYVNLCFHAFARLCKIHQHDKEIELTFRCERRVTGEQQIKQRQIDLFLPILGDDIKLSDIGETFLNEQVVINRLVDFPVLVVLRKDHPALKNFTTPEQFDFSSLCQYPFVDYARSHEELPSFVQYFEKLGIINNHKVIFVTDRAWRIQILREMNAFSATTGITTDELVTNNCTAIEIPHQKLPMMAVYNALSYKNPLLKEYLNYVIEDITSYLSMIKTNPVFHMASS